MTASTELLNELFVLEYRSLPMFLAWASPDLTYTGPDAAAELQNVIQNEQQNAQRIGETIMELGVTVDSGDFPIQWTSLHDLSFDYLLDELVGFQRKKIARIEQIANELSGAGAARALAEETLGAARAHLDAFLGLRSRQPA